MDEENKTPEENQNQNENKPEENQPPKEEVEPKSEEKKEEKPPSEDKSKKIFRKKALEKLSSPEQLDTLMSIIKPKGWIALFAFVGIIVLCILWAIFGRIDTIVKGEGIYLDYTRMHPIAIPVKGHVLEIPISVGAKVAKGEVVAILWDELNKNKKEIKAPFTGTIIDIHIEKGETVVIDEVIAKIMEKHPVSEKTDRFYCFVDAKQGDKIRKGMLVNVFPWGEERSAYGGIMGEVEKISYLPASEDYFKRIYLNKAFAARLSSNLTLIPVIIRGVVDVDEPSGFVWTSKDGPDEMLPLGSFVTFQVIVSTRSPLSYLFPLWYFKRVAN
jgi:biotin carboxyl carrier protein